MFSPIASAPLAASAETFAKTGAVTIASVAAVTVTASSALFGSVAISGALTAEILGEYFWGETAENAEAWAPAGSALALWTDAGRDNEVWT